jgi:hypothetical protein
LAPHGSVWISKKQTNDPEGRTDENGKKERMRENLCRTSAYMHRVLCVIIFLLEYIAISTYAAAAFS